MHRDRHEDHRRHEDGRAAESGRRHAGDGQRLAVDDQRVAEHLAGSTQFGLPELVAQDDDWMPADRLVDFRARQSSQCRNEAQRREVRSGDLRPLDPDGLPPIRHAGGETAVSDEIGEDRLLPLEGTEHRVAEDLVAPARPVAALRAGLGSRGFEVDQPFRLDDRQRAQQELAVEGEDRRVGPDTEGERHHRHARDDRGLAQHAQPESDVRHHSLQLVGEPQAARLPAFVLCLLRRCRNAPGHVAPPPVCGTPGTNQVLGVGVEVEPHLFVEGALEALPPGPRRQKRTRAREHFTPRPGWRQERPPWLRRAVPIPPRLPENDVARRRSGGSTSRAAGSRSRPTPTR